MGTTTGRAMQASRAWPIAALAAAIAAALPQGLPAAHAASPAQPAASTRSADPYVDLIRSAVQLRNAERYEESLRKIDEAGALEADKGSASMVTQFHRGVTLARMGRHDDAVAAFGRGVPLQPDYPLVYWHRAASLEALGREEEARADLERFAKLMPGWIKRRGAPSAERRAEFRDKLIRYGLADEARWAR